MTRFLTNVLASMILVLAAVAAGQAEEALPAEAQCYFDAVAAKDAEAVGGCMAEDAWVLDVNRQIDGRAAIVAWAAREVIGGVYTVDDITFGKDGVQLLVTFTPPGASSGFKANYVMSLRGGKIASMALSYA